MLARAASSLLMHLRVVLVLQHASLLLACFSFERVDRRLVAFATLPACSSVTLRAFPTHAKERCAVDCSQHPSCKAFLATPGLCMLMSDLCRAASVEATQQIMMRPSPQLRRLYPTHRRSMYRLTDSKGSYDHVRAMCEQYGMRLWVPDDLEELNAVETSLGLDNATADRVFFGRLFHVNWRVLNVFIGVRDIPQGNCITIDNTTCPDRKSVV